jgi:hypothetical protein
MKQFFIYSAFLIVAGAMVAMATDADLTQRQVRDPKKLAVILDTRTVVQTDTNATTTITLYTPARVGQILVGNVSSNAAVWVSSGTATSSWVKVSN